MDEIYLKRLLVLNGDEFIAGDKNVLFEEMRSRIIFEEPDDAICKYAELADQLLSR